MSAAWKALANKHSAIESNINFPDKGIRGYRRYTGLGVLAYNLHKIGNHLLEKSRVAKKKKRPLAF